MAKITTLFIDKGGVLIDNTTLSPQYRRLLGEFLPAELGGDPAAWENANVGAAHRAYQRYQQAYVTSPSTSIREWYAEDVRRWLYEMCYEVCRPRPPAHQADRIAKTAHAYVRRRISIRAPRIVERLRDFHERGLTLHVASGDQHADLIATRWARSSYSLACTAATWSMCGSRVRRTTARSSPTRRPMRRTRS